MKRVIIPEPTTINLTSLLTRKNDQTIEKNHKIVKISTENLSYHGTKKSTEISGYGLLTSKSSKERYKGEFKNNKKHGIGNLEFEESGVSYTGMFKDDKFHGVGEIKFDQDSILTAIFKEGNLTGFCRIEKKQEKSSIKGFFDQGYLHGWGKIITQNSTFEGKFLKGVKNGLGISKTEKNFYKGNWENDQKSGFGEQRNRRYVYIGEFTNGKEHGIGKLKPNSRSYSGEIFEYFGGFSKGKKNGFGKFISEKGVYIGGWSNDKKMGLVIIEKKIVRMAILVTGSMIKKTDLGLFFVRKEKLKANFVEGNYMEMELFVLKTPERKKCLDIFMEKLKKK